MSNWIIRIVEIQFVNVLIITETEQLRDFCRKCSTNIRYKSQNDMFSYMEWHIFDRLNINALAKHLFHNLHKKLVKTRIGSQNHGFLRQF